MYLVIFCIIIGIIIGFRNAYTHPYMNDDWITYGFFSFLGFLFGAGGGIVLALLITGLSLWSGLATEHDEKKGRWNIVALADNSETHGHFFLGAGHVDEQMQYFFMYEKDGGAYMHNVQAQGTKIVEEDIEPYIEKFCTEIISRIRVLIINPPRCRYEIHIPKGSIMRDYRIDLQ